MERKGWEQRNRVPENLVGVLAAVLDEIEEAYVFPWIFPGYFQMCATE